MVEDFLEQHHIGKRRWLIFGTVAVAVLVVMGVGLNTIISGVFKGPHAPAKTKGAVSRGASGGGSGSQGASTNDDRLGNIVDANFSYLMPSNDDAWTMQASTETYDASKGLVKYEVKLKNAGTVVTISQQAMPSTLMPRDSAAFNEFVESNKPTRSMDAGSGKAYFLPALQNGVPANGADTVIFATNEVLMFGRAERVVGYDGWTKLLSTMKPY